MIDISDLRASINGKDVPEDIKARLLGLHEDNVHLKEQLKTSQDKLVKARAVTIPLHLSNAVQITAVFRSLSSHRTNYLKKKTQDLMLHLP